MCKQSGFSRRFVRVGLLISLCSLNACTSRVPPAPQPPATGAGGATIDQVCRITAELMALAPSKVTSDTSLADLGADELDFVELIMQLEETFSVSIPDESAERMIGTSDWQAGLKNVTMKQLAALVDERRSQSPNKPAKSLDPYAGVPDNQPVIHRTQAGQPDKDGWCLAKPSRGNFSIMLPGKFLDTMTKSTTTTGGTGVMHTVATQTADGIEFNVLQTEIIGKRPEAMDRPVDGMISRFEKKGATVTRTQVTIDGRSADRLRVTAPGVTAEFVFITTAANDYMLAVQSRSSSPLPEQDIDRFFESFKTLPP